MEPIDNMSLNIISLNVRGLGDPTKRRAIFLRYRKSCDILCLQETHSANDSEELWRSEWGGRAYFSHGESNARGVAIFVNRSWRHAVNSVTKDNDGCSMCINVTANEKSICIMNIYAPNKDSPVFFQNKFLEAQQQNEQVVIIGDFNTVLNTELD